MIIDDYRNQCGKIAISKDIKFVERNIWFGSMKIKDLEDCVVLIILLKLFVLFQNLFISYFWNKYNNYSAFIALNKSLVD